MKAKRINKVENKKPVKITLAGPSKIDETLQAGRKVKIILIPKNIKKANKLFKVDKKYVIQEPPKGYLNTGMGVHLKGKDGQLYQVGFPYFRKVAN